MVNKDEKTKTYCVLCLFDIIIIIIITIIIIISLLLLLPLLLLVLLLISLLLLLLLFRIAFRCLRLLQQFFVVVLF